MTANDLIALWLERDARYGIRKRMGRPQLLSPEEESSIMAYRRSEIERFLTGPSRARATAVLSAWSRPLAR